MRIPFAKVCQLCPLGQKGFLSRFRKDERGAAAVSAYNSRDNVSFAAMPAYVRGVSGDGTSVVTLSCNGVAGSCTNFSRTFACLKSDGTYVASTEGSTCTGTGMTAGSTAGYYFTIEATRPFEAMIIPDTVIDGSNMAQRATIRLE